MIVPILLALLTSWRPHFASDLTRQRAVRHALALVASLGRGTITGLLRTLGQTTQAWHADYRFYTQRVWSPDRLFDTLLPHALPYGHASYVVVGLDDTGVPKTGKKIPFVTWGRAPGSPHFRVNLCRQLRFVHAVLLLPLYQTGATAARALPIRFTCAPPVKRPKPEASSAAKAAYRQQHALASLPAVGLRLLQELRHVLDTLGQHGKTLLAVMDGSYCNRTLFRTVVPGVHWLARCRKNLTLCHRDTTGGRRFYAPETFTPEGVRLDATRPWQAGIFWYGGAQRELRYKEVSDVYWRSGGQRRTLRLLVLAPTGYRPKHGGKKLYRQPAYLLTTDLTASAAFLIQSYLDRWQIEVAHREEKTLFRVGQAQVRHPQAVVRQPAFTVAVYSAVLLAALLATQDQRTAAFLDTPAWYDGPSRPSLEDILRVMRQELLEHPERLTPYGATFDAVTLVHAAAA